MLPAKGAGFPPAGLGPGEYLTTVFATRHKGGAPELLVARMLAVGTK